MTVTLVTLTNISYRQNYDSMEIHLLDLAKSKARKSQSECTINLKLISNIITRCELIFLNNLLFSFFLSFILRYKHKGNPVIETEIKVMYDKQVFYSNASWKTYFETMIILCCFSFCYVCLFLSINNTLCSKFYRQEMPKNVNLTWTYFILKHKDKHSQR